MLNAKPASEMRLNNPKKPWFFDEGSLKYGNILMATIENPKLENCAKRVA
jgi:hypothetical protein